MNILILTDHSRHTIHNSVYGIARALVGHPSVNSVFVASRSLDSNKQFFEASHMQSLWAVKINEDFSFPADAIFLESRKSILADFDLVFLRLPRPIPANFFSSLIEHFDENKIINKPSGIIKTSNKAFLVNLKKYTPPTALCHTIEEIVEFKNQFPIVLKPLEEYGGKGIVRIDNDTVFYNDAVFDFEQFTRLYKKEPQVYLGMKFLKNVSLGDKRIVVVDGDILSVALRLPSKDNWLCNVSQGGTSHASVADQKEKEMVAAISPILKELGIFYYGMDTLVEDNGERVISEINTLSIGGIVPSEISSGIPLSKIFADKFIRYSLCL